MTYFQAYLLTRLDSFGQFFGIIFLFSAVALFISSIIYAVGGGEWEDSKVKAVRKTTLPFLKYSVIFVIICSFISALIPTTKEAAFIYIAPAIVNNQDIQKTIKKIPELSGLGLEYLGEILKEEIKDAKAEAVSETKKAVKEAVE